MTIIQKGPLRLDVRDRVRRSKCVQYRVPMKDADNSYPVIKPEVTIDVPYIRTLDLRRTVVGEEQILLFVLSDTLSTPDTVVFVVLGAMKFIGKVTIPKLMYLDGIQVYGDEVICESHEHAKQCEERLKSLSLEGMVVDIFEDVIDQLEKGTFDFSEDATTTSADFVKEMIETWLKL